MKKITLLLIISLLSYKSNAQTVMSHSASQEITDPISIICQSYDDTDITWDLYCAGIWDDTSYSCPPNSFIAGSSGNYVIRLTDIFGNGWNGVTLGVDVNEQTVLSGLDVEFGRWMDEYTFYAEQGDVVNVGWETTGPWFNECGYKVASQEAISSVEFPSNTYSQGYFRQFVPHDFGYEGNLDLTHIQFGVWYTDVNGNPNSNLPDVNVDARIWVNTDGGVGGNWGLTFDPLVQLAYTNDITITANDHQTIVTAPIEFDVGGNILENGLQAIANNEYVVQLIFPDGITGPGSDNFRLTTGGNYGGFNLEQTNQSPNPSTINYDSACQGFFTYTPDNTSLINLISPTIPSGLSVNDNTQINVTVTKDINSEFIVVKGLANIENMSIKIYNLTGQELLSKNLEALQVQEVGTSYLSSGIYLVKLHSNELILSKKILIK